MKALLPIILILQSACYITLEDRLGEYEGAPPVDEREAVAETLYLWQLVSDLGGVSLGDVKTHWIHDNHVPEYNKAGVLTSCSEIWIARYTADVHKTLAHEVLHCLLSRTEIGMYDHRSEYWYDPLDTVAAGLKMRGLLNWED